jgi:hypothetical protein
MDATEPELSTLGRLALAAALVGAEVVKAARDNVGFAPLRSARRSSSGA